MKSLVTILLILSATINVEAQTFQEWFAQKKTQIKYLVEQIAAFKIYADYLEKGYMIVNEGTSMINDIKHGDFNLHRNFFQDLLRVKPFMKNSGPVFTIISNHSSTARLWQELLSRCRQSGQIPDAELNYISAVWLGIDHKMGKDLVELQSLLSDGNWQLNDFERLKRIQFLATESTNQYQFTRSFFKETLQLSGNREIEGFETERLKKIYGIKMP